MKTVTATAAIDTGKYTPNSMVSGRNHKVISGTPLSNFGGEDFGDVTLTFALTHSINTVYAEVGEKLGKATLAEYMQRFGFGTDPPMDYPTTQMEPSGSYRNGHADQRALAVRRRRAHGDRPGALLATPLQMAEVVQTIGNGGVRMQPRLGQKVVDPDGRTVETPAPEEAERVMSSQTAAALTAMMKQVVKEGTGTAAALQGVDVAGKTGTAEIDVANGINDLWFIGFTPQGGGGGRGQPRARHGRPGGRPDRQGGPGGAERLMHGIARDTIVDGRYRAEKRLGSGGMAEVWCAEDDVLGRRVALKLLGPAVRRGRRVPRALPPRGAGRGRADAPEHRRDLRPRRLGGTPYIAMELVDGRTLKDLVRERGPLPPDVATNITLQMLRALGYAHRRGIVHRDVKPQNVILDHEGQAKVADFGIARAGASEMTETGTIVGTAQYVSPEQAQGQPVSPRSDLYSAGIVLYELLTGRVPFDGESPVSIALKQVSEPPVPPSQLRPGISPALEAVVMRALEKDPARRFAERGRVRRRAGGGPARAGAARAAGAGGRRAVGGAGGRAGSRWWLWLLACS